MDSKNTLSKILLKIRMNQSKIILCFVFLIGLLLRMFYIYFYSIDPVDALQYMNIAKYIIGNPEVTYYVVPREPLFPLFLGVVYLIAPNTYTTSRILTGIIGSASIILIYFIIKKYDENSVKKDTKVNLALFGAAFISFNPYLIRNDGAGLREPLYTFLLLLLIFTILLQKSVKKDVLLCLISMLCVLCKSEALLLLIGLSFLLYHRNVVKNNLDKKSSLFESLSVLIGTLFGFVLWGTVSIFLFSDWFATSNYMASLYFVHEFNSVPLGKITTFSYLFKYHSFMELSSAFLDGFFGTLWLYFDIFDLFVYAFFIIALLELVKNSDLFFLYVTLFSTIFIGIFASLYGWSGFRRILLPYSVLSVIYIPTTISNLMQSASLKFSKRFSINFSKST